MDKWTEQLAIAEHFTKLPYFGNAYYVYSCGDLYKLQVVSWGRVIKVVEGTLDDIRAYYVEIRAISTSKSERYYESKSIERGNFMRMQISNSRMPIGAPSCTHGTWCP